MLIFKGDEVCTIPSQPPQSLRFSQGRGERLVMNRKEPWEEYTPVDVPLILASGYEADPIAFHLCFDLIHDPRISES